MTVANDQPSPSPSAETIALCADDIGFISGVVIVDRLRTVQGVGLDVAPHIARFELSCQAVGIQLPTQAELLQRVEAEIATHRARFAPRDFSIVMLATPGRLAADPPQATLLFQTSPIDWPRLANWYRRGQRLGLSAHCNVPAACWSPAIKTRARLQYYLADRQVQLVTGEPQAAALLLDTDGFLTETSAANVLIVEGERLISPRREKILDGISLRRTRDLASRNGYPIIEEDITPERALQADALLLSGSTGCLWPAAQLEQRVYTEATKHPLYVRLCQAWQRDLQFDFVGQAVEYGG